MSPTFLLARSVSRQKGISDQNRFRGWSVCGLVRQLFTESVILAAAGGLLGLGAQPDRNSPSWRPVGGQIVPRTEGIHLDEQVIAFTCVASLLTALLFGLLPAFRASRVDLARAVKRSGWDALAGGSYRLRSVLVVSELALSVMLLIGAGLLMKSLWHLGHVDPGFSAANVLGMRISVPEVAVPWSRERAVLYQELIDRIQTLPGVDGAAATNDLPFSGSRTSTSFDIEGFHRYPASRAIRIIGQ